MDIVGIIITVSTVPAIPLLLPAPNTAAILLEDTLQLWLFKYEF